MLNSFFPNSNFDLLFTYLWRSLSNLRLMSALWGEMKVTARTPHAGSSLSTLQSARTSCHVLLPSIDVCSVSGPPTFVTLIACISSLQHAPEAQCLQGEEGRGEVSKHTAGVA